MALCGLLSLGSIAFAIVPANAEPHSLNDLPMLSAPPGPLSGAFKNTQPTQQQLASLTPEERKAVAVVVELRHVTTGLTPLEFKSRRQAGTITPNGCGQYNDNIYAWNGTDDIWRWSLPVNWCWNGSQVTSIQPLIVSFHVYAWASALGWSYVNTIDKAQWDYYGDRWVYRNYAQGHFAYCPIRIGCLQDMYPTNTLTRTVTGVRALPGGVVPAAHRVQIR